MADGESRPRDRVRLIQDEVRRLAAGGAPDANSASSGGRSKVQRLIMQEIEAMLEDDRQPGGSGSAARLASAQSAYDRQPARLATGQSTFSTASSRIRRYEPKRAASVPVLAPVGEEKPKDAKSMLLTKADTLEPSTLTRKTMNGRTPYGGFVCDVKPWLVDTSTKPILPSKEVEISQRLWGSINPDYAPIPMVSDSHTFFTDPMQLGPQVRLFMNPRDEFIDYRNEVFKPSNQLCMRKGGGGMPKIRPTA